MYADHFPVSKDLFFIVILVYVLVFFMAVAKNRGGKFLIG